jgi:hypothetical protein
MADFAQASNVPLLLAPGGLEEARSRVEEDEPPKLSAITGMAEPEDEPGHPADVPEAHEEHEDEVDEGPESYGTYESPVDYPPASMEG